MRIEVGSNFWEYQLGGERAFKFWWEKEPFNTAFTKSGRNSLKAICEILNEECAEHKVLLPEYLCETEIDPFRESGWDVAFYLIKRDYTIDAASLKSMIDSYKPAVILIQSFYGFNTISPENEAILKEAQKNGVIIVEDLTQSLFSDVHTDFADYYTTSLRKFITIPDGGVLFSKKDISSVKIYDDVVPIDDTAKKAFDLKKEYFVTLNPDTKTEFRNKYQELADQIGVNDKVYAISKLSKEIFDSFDPEIVMVKRKQNYELLAGLLQGVSRISLPLPAECGKAAPLYLPIYFETEEERNDCRAHMAKNAVYCPVIWQKPVHYAVQNPESLYIYEHILCIPIDQRYDEDDMRRAADVLIEWVSGEQK